MTDDTFREDAAAWVLGALPDEEVAAFRMRLRSDPELAAEVARLQPVADVLPMAADQVEPPRELRARVMDVVWAEAARAPAAEFAPARRGPLSRVATMLRRRPAYAAGLAAACLAVGVAVGVGVGGGSSGAGSRTIRAQVLAPGASGELIVAGDHAQLHVAKLPAPSAGHVYQVWVQRPGGPPQPTDALFKVTRGGAATVDVPGGVQGVERVMVTAEPDGGSLTPSSAPIVVARAA